MKAIQIENNPAKSKLKELDTQSWPIWECERSEFPWTYTEKETCVILEGEVIVTPEGEESVTIRAGDLVIFPAGMSCSWNVVKPIRKHYQFG